MRGWLALVAIVSACKFVPPGGTSDGATGDDASPPGDDGPDAFVLGDWGPPTVVAELNSAQNDDDPSLTADMLEIYFCSTRLPDSADEDIYFATRATVNEPFGTPVMATSLSSAGFDSNVEISADGLMVTFTSNRGGLGADLYFATRATRGSPWTNPALVQGVNSAAGEWGGVITQDRLAMVLCSDVGGDEAIYLATRTTTTAPFGTPMKIKGLDTANNDCDATLPADTIYFTRAALGSQDLDLYSAQRTEDGYDHVQPVTSLNTTARDGDPWVSPDQRTMYFASNRPTGGVALDDIYMSTR